MIALPLIVVLPALGAAAAPWVSRRLGAWSGAALAVVPAGLLIWLLSAGAVGEWRVAWGGALGFDLALRMSPVRWYFATLVCGVGIAVSVYAAGYFAKSADKRGRLLVLLYLFMAAMLGLTVADSLIVLVLFWEATSVLSFLMVGFYGSDPAARKAAVDALLVTGGGGLALVLAVILLGQIGDTYQLSELALQAAHIQADDRYHLVIALTLVAVMTKSAQMPLHFWLPGAMTAPAPVSAYLHSATMVKAGIFLVLLLTPILGGTGIWRGALQLIGAISMTAAALLALLQTDLKRLLAYSTISALGTLLTLVGLGTVAALKAALVFLVVHALYKAALFMVAGALEKATGTRDVRQLHGLQRELPLLAVAAATASLSMAGVPPFLGFAAKELVYEAKLDDWTTQPLLWAAFVANAATVAVAVKVGFLPFFRRSTKPRSIEKLPNAMIAAPLALGVAGLVFGLAAGPLMESALNAALGDVSSTAAPVKLKLWHGFNRVLLLSLVTLATGVWLLRGRSRWWAWRRKLPEELRGGVQQWFRGATLRSLAGASAATARLHSGRLSTYVAILLASAVALVAVAAIAGGMTIHWRGWQPLSALPVVAAIMICLACLAAARAADPVAAVLLLGCAGYALSLLYGTLGAPDVAITQLLVETLTLLVVAGLLRRLPPLQRAKRRWDKIVLACMVGVTTTLLTLRAVSVQSPSAVAQSMGELSLIAAQGRNVVNVILVDFRAFDTLGEVIVLVLAMVGIAAMVGTPRRRQPAAPALWNGGARVLGPLLAVAAVACLLRGHNEPGGGFIGGLLLAVALWLWGVAKPENQRLRRASLARWLAAGGALACLLSGLPAVLGGAPYMTAAWWGKLWMPGLGKVGLGTPLVFDLGVFAAVAGITLAVLQRLAMVASENALAED